MQCMTGTRAWLTYRALSCRRPYFQVENSTFLCWKLAPTCRNVMAETIAFLTSFHVVYAVLRALSNLKDDASLLIGHQF